MRLVLWTLNRADRPPSMRTCGVDAAGVQNCQNLESVGAGRARRRKLGPLARNQPHRLRVAALQVGQVFSVLCLTTSTNTQITQTNPERRFWILESTLKQAGS